MTSLETATQPDWDVLVDAVRNGRCTPFVGAGASEPYLPRGADLARQLAERDPELGVLYGFTSAAAAGSGV